MAAFQTLNGIARGRERVALIGDIKALGSIAVEVHRQVGDMVAELGVDRLITVGVMAEEIANQAMKRGLRGQVHSYPTIHGVFELLKRVLDQNTLMLVKCSSQDLQIISLIKRFKQR